MTADLPTPSEQRSSSGSPRRVAIAALEILAVAILAVSAVSCRRSRGRPNVLLITIDTLRADHLSCYGYPLSTTPRIDEIARGGALFEDAHCQIPKTNPSLASLFTGLSPENHKVITLRLTLSPAYTLLTKRLHDAGYRTGAVVGQYNLIRQSGFARGFDDYFDHFPASPAAPLSGGHFFPNTEKRAAELTDQALAWLGNRTGRPFFLWIHYVDPHAAYDPPPPFDHSFPEERYASAILDPAQIHHYAFDPPHFELRYYQQRYDGEIRYLDTQIGRLLDGLRRSGEWDETLVIFTADHGEYMGDRDGPTAASEGPVPPYFSHGVTLTSGETHVPLLWRLPSSWVSQRTSARIPGPVEVVDIAPTLLDLLQLPPLKGDGRSLATALRTGRDATSSAGLAFSYSCESNSASIQSSKWKLIYYPKASLAAFFIGKETVRSIGAEGRALLFDRSEGQHGHDVAGSRPEIVQTLRRELLLRLERAPGPRDPARYPVNIPWDDTEHLKRLRALGYI